PAAVSGWRSDLDDLDSFGIYWSSELLSGYSISARSLGFFSDHHKAWDFDPRFRGLSVRAVCPAACDDEDDLSTAPSTVGGTIAKASEAVDLGLSVKWAPWNVGATKAGEAGAYFAWGEAQAGKESYDWSTYWWMADGQSDRTHINKYQAEDNQTEADWYDSTGAFLGDGKTTLEKSDDAASVNWGGEWRMPTWAELNELSKKCTWEWKEEGEYESGSLPGYLVTGPNGGSVFLPAAGRSDLYGFGWYGFYWSSELYSGNSNYASLLGFNSGDRDAWIDYRCSGLSVRAVCPAAE
ncbi:hypothetical protein NP174_23170, partial [Salmonella enterica]|nr:hypothetical protein [Salmonella enterica]